MTAAVVAGFGYVGLPLAMRAMSVGHDVTGYNTDAVRVKAPTSWCCSPIVMLSRQLRLAVTRVTYSTADGVLSGPNVEML